MLRNCCARFVSYVERKNPKRVLQNWCVRFVNYVEQKDKALVALSSKMVAGPLPQKDFSRPEEANLPASYLGPGEVMWFTPHGDRLLTAEESEAITQGTAAIYVFGEIRYVDAFGKRRHTTFRAIARGEHGYMHTEKDRKDVLRLSVDREGGNDAN